MDLIFYVVMTLLMVEMLLNLRYRLIKLLPKIGNSNSLLLVRFFVRIFVFAKEKNTRI